MLASVGRSGGVFNVATGVETSVTELVEGMRAAVGSAFEVEHGEERLGDLQRSVLDPSLAERGLGWRPETPLEDGLRATWDFFCGD